MADVRLINANALLEKECCGRISGKDVRNAPTINPEDCRPHGRWHYTASKGVVSLNGYCCSVCYDNFFSEPYNYCPNCGAKMDGKE